MTELNCQSLSWPTYSSDSELTSDEEDFASLPVINVTSVNARGAGVDDALADAQLAESEVNTDMEGGELLRSETTLEEVNDDPQPTSSQAFRRDSNAMGLVISDSVSLQESMTQHD